MSNADPNSDNYDSEFQTFAAEPAIEEPKQQAKEDTERDIPVHINEQVIETPKEQMKVSQREQVAPQTTFPTRVSTRNVDEPPLEGVKVTPRQYSTDSLQQSRVSAKVTAQDSTAPTNREEKANSTNPTNPDHSYRQEAKTPPSVIAKLLDEPLNVVADKKLNRTISFPKIPKDEIRSPLKEVHVAPRQVSSEEVIKEISPPALEKEDIRASTGDVRASLSDALATTEDEEMVVLPPNFKMRKSKKRFSTKY